jgi:hypothetical protein
MERTPALEEEDARESGPGEVGGRERGGREDGRESAE